jgi:hypothetical protein
MPTYILPQVQVFQDFAAAPAAAVSPLRSHVSGPHAKLIRYAQDAEREQGRLGVYDRLSDAVFDWPGRPAGGLLDRGYVKVWMRDALLHYFDRFIGQAGAVTKVAGYSNRLHSPTVNFAANANAARDAVFFDRDVKVGDIALVRGITGAGASVSLWTYVKALLADQVATTVGAADVDTSNPPNQPAGAFVAKVGGVITCADVTADGTAYDGTVSGDITETYDLLVLNGSVNGDYTKAAVRVISGSGGDDVASVTPAAAGTPTAVGTRGLRVTFHVNHAAACSASAAAAGVGADDLVAGQRWQVTVQQAFTRPTPTSGGTYTGAQDTTYIITVARGGLLGGAVPPQIRVSTTNGVDLAAPADVAGAGVPVPVGSLGVTVAFAGAALRAGDRYYVDVTGTSDGPVRVLVLGNSLDPDIPDGSALDVSLFIRKPLLQIARDRQGAAPLTNWDVSDTQLTVHSGVTAYDAGWTQGGVQRPLDVYGEAGKNYGLMYAEVRYWLPDLSTAVGAVADVGAIDAIPGALDPDNPLKWGVFKALENSNGTEVKFTAVRDPDDDAAWADVLGLLLGHDDVYGLVPLTYRRTVLDLFAAHVKSQSSPDQGLWRVLWVNLQGLPEVPVVAASSDVPGHTAATTSDGLVALGTVQDDPQSAGIQYTILRSTSGNANFVQNGVRAGDVARVLYTSDGFGGETYSEYVVDEVESEEQLRLLSGPDAPVNVGAKFEVWRNLNPTEEADAVARNAGSWGDRRVRAVWPDRVESSGTVMDGYFLCCSLAGLASGILPHQPMTHLEVVGYTDVSRTTGKFNRTQLDALAAAGTWVVTQDMTGLAGAVGRVFTRHALTTGNYNDINQREEVLTRNVDSISYQFQDTFRPFIGITNVTPTIQARLSLATRNMVDVLSDDTNVNLGGQLISGTIADVRRSTAFQDRYVVIINCELPYPFNNVDLHLVV